ncbi:J domain-containing protein [Sulfurimonas sp.]|uniref:J domain-containing protein n=1 Tax=Sulfurimonas sp. TaxID=2022749 RepID=UPI00356306A1
MDEEYIIFNLTLGVRDFVTIGEIDEHNTNAWLEEPYDMVGPFSLDELYTNGQISFAACIVMSRERWKKERIFLQQEAFRKQQRAQQEHFENIRRYNRKKAQNDDIEHRELLCLPANGELKVSQIKAAYRKIIKKVHPDVGGSHEKFIQITEARDTLLEKWD